MDNRLQVLAIVLSWAFLVLVLELIRRRRLAEEYAVLWIVVAGALIVVSIWRELLHAAARELGVYDPPNVLLIALTAVVVVAMLRVSVILSHQRRQIERLLEDTAVLGAELEALRARRTDSGRTAAG